MNERFTEVACELVNRKSPSKIRQEELARLIAQQSLDLNAVDLLISDIFDDSEFLNGER